MSKLASASWSPSSTTLNCSSNELGPTCLLMLISMAVFAGKSCSMSATSPSSSPLSFASTNFAARGEY
ncbi:hypothetical protein FIBSPDRAFT_872243, partial [Athelia psychrophila]